MRKNITSYAEEYYVFEEKYIFSFRILKAIHIFAENQE